MATRTVDVKSWELAQHFIADYAHHFGWKEQDDLTMKLAHEIQQAVEDWLSGLDRMIDERVEPFPGHSHFGG